MPNDEVPEGSPEFYETIRRALVGNRKMTLARWCREHDVKFGTARSALIGSSNSWAARELRRKIVKDARV